MQPSQYALNFAGPFLGLNTVQAPHMLAPGFATVAENVLITRAGGVRPRDPWKTYWPYGMTSKAGIVMGMLHIDATKLAGSTDSMQKLRVLAKMMVFPPFDEPTGQIEGRLGLFAAFPDNEAGGQYVDLPGSLPYSLLTPTWVLANRRVYVVDGSDRMVQYDGDKVFTIGMDKPTSEWKPDPDDLDFPSPPTAMVAYGRFTGETGPDAGVYRYVVTLYNSTYGIESNSDQPPGSTTFVMSHTGTTRIKVQVQPALFHQGQGVTGVRIYRRHVSGTDGEELGFPFRLIGEIDWAGGDGNVWNDDVPDDEVTLSDVVTGPFAPTRNGIPPAARIAVWYKNRMWYADPDDGSRLWYSELAFPEHVGATSFILIGGDSDDVITGMVEMGGQVFILKRDSIWVLSGDLETYDNAKVALALIPGVDFVESFPEVYKTGSKTGCHNAKGGNGAIVCGHPPRIYYSNANGLYRFDGVDDRLISNWIMDEWAVMLRSRESASEMAHSMTYAVDLANEALYVCPTGPHGGQLFPSSFLCYQWGMDRGDGVGVWTVVTNASDPLPHPDFSRVGIACIATSLGTPHQIAYPFEKAGGVSPYLVAELYGYQPVEDFEFRSILRYVELDVSQEGIPDWRWRTGDLMLAAGKKAHAYYLEYRHERATPEVGTGPHVKVQYAIDGGALELLSPSEDGQETAGLFMRRLRLGRSGRSLTLEFGRGKETVWEPWNGLTGFAVDVELAEQR